MGVVAPPGAAASAIPLGTTIPDLGGVNLRGLKLRGISMASSPDPATPLNSNYWGTGWSLATAKLDIANTVACGANLIRPVGNGHEVISGAITLQTYLAHWKAYLDETLRVGLTVYPTLVETNALALNGATPTLSAIQPIMVALARLLDGYANVAGINLFNEITNGKQGQSWVDATHPLIRAATTKPLTCDIYVNGRPFPTTGYAASVAAWADFLDIHSYVNDPDGGSTGAYLVRASDFDGMAAAFGLPMIVGEVSGWDDVRRITGAITAHREVAERPDMAGVVFWCLREYEHSAGAGATYDPALTNAFVGNPPSIEQTPYVVAAFRTIPTRTTYGDVRSIPVINDATDGPTVIPLSALDGRGDRQVIARAIVGADVPNGDTVTITLRDAADDSILATGTAAASGVGGAMQLVNAAGGDPAVIQLDVAFPDGASGFGQELSVAGNGRVDFPAVPNRTGSQPFSFEARFRTTDLGTEQTICALWSGTGRQLAKIYIGGDGNMALVWQGAGGFTGIFAPFSPITENTRHVVELSYDGTTFRAFLDGVLGASLAGALPGGSWTTAFSVGGDSDQWSKNFYGQVDEVRYSTVARHTANYTPATGPFTSDGNTLVLAHFDVGEGAATAVAATNPLLLAAGGAEFSAIDPDTLVYARVDTASGAGEITSLLLEGRTA